MKTAAAATGTNIGTAVANQTLGFVNQNTPYGSLTYDQTGVKQWTDPSNGQVYDLPQYTANQTFTPAGQKLQNATMATQQNLANLGRDQSGRIGSLLSKPMNMNGLPAQRTSYDTTGGNSRERVEQAIMGRMQGGLDRDRTALEQRLADQGIQYGSQAFNSAMDDHGRQVNDARLGAVLAGGQEQSRMVGLSAGQAAFQNQARQQALSERYAHRNQPLNEIAALMSGSQVQNPTFQNIQGPQAATTDVAGIIGNNYAQQMAGYQANQGMWGGIMGAGANLLMLSDRRAKEDIKEVGKLNNGEKVFSYRYKSGGPIQLGLMAQNVKKSNPDAVTTLPGGLMAVDYGKATK